MSKRNGPCFHCGIDSSPHWRVGPEDRPVLCNACGIRFLKRGSDGLQGYVPNNFNPDNLDNVPDLMAETKSPSLWNFEIPKGKRSRVVRMEMTPMERFHQELLKLWKSECENSAQSSKEYEDTILMDNVTNFIPSNEIGLGCMLLKPGDDASD